jgi:D-beta-D-heptose 7-phosphate kinase/D-beta-D-heptose 1-phosphate adenosyltransferase
VRKLKGSTRPINNQEDRKKMLEALRCVDEVIIFEEDTPYQLISRLRPNILTKGGDYSIDNIRSRSLVEEVIIIPFKEGYSTTNIVEKIKNAS